MMAPLWYPSILHLCSVVLQLRALKTSQGGQDRPEAAKEVQGSSQAQNTSSRGGHASHAIVLCTLVIYKKMSLELVDVLQESVRNVSALILYIPGICWLHNAPQRV